MAAAFVAAMANMMALAMLGYGAIIFLILTVFVCQGVFGEQDKAKKMPKKEKDEGVEEDGGGARKDEAFGFSTGDLPDIVAPRRRHGAVPDFWPSPKDSAKSAV